MTRVGFLSNNDPFALKYAQWTKDSCYRNGIQFELHTIDKMDLEQRISNANTDNRINGIMIVPLFVLYIHCITKDQYYPVFNSQQDQYIQNTVNIMKDVSSVCICVR